MTIIEFIKDKVMTANNIYVDKAADHYNFWEQHIKLVVKEALMLADAYGADKEIVELSALLHDIALVSEVGTRAEHHVNGKIISQKLLKEFKYPDDKIEKVLGCVLHHRSSKYAENIEELCVADADIISHYDNIPMCFGAAFKYNKIDTQSVAEWIKYFEHDYNDLSDRTKQIFKPRYDMIMEVLFGALL